MSSLLTTLIILGLIQLLFFPLLNSSFNKDKFDDLFKKSEELSKRVDNLEEELSKIKSN